MTLRVVIQSRLSSTRLPAKGLLPVAGMPSVVLCALRAANTGLDVVVATSSDLSDDLTVEALREAGIRYVRGSLNNVLDRFCLATEDLKAGDMVVRLTADNLFPDGTLIEELVRQFAGSNLKYMGSQSPLDRLPYGMSAEIFSVGVLRLAQESADSSYDREHVTPWIKRNYGMNIFKPDSYLGNLSSLRCTMDSFQDYLRVSGIFSVVNNPVAAKWTDLCKLLAGGPGKDNFAIPLRLKNSRAQSEFALGTVQLGLKYGIANRAGLPSMEEVVSIVRYAVDRGLTHIDCARGYGDAEHRLGKALTGGYAERVEVITKLDPLADAAALASPACLRQAVDASVFRSCRELNTGTLQTLLLHRWEHRYLEGGAVWQRLVELKQEGVINRLGVSVQTPEEALQALADPEVGHIQLPFNILDWRWKKYGIDRASAEREDVIVHARSTLLQGLLTLGNTKMPNTPPELALKINQAIDYLVKVFERDSRTDLCIAYVRAQSWIDSLVIGVETLAQLQENIALFQNTTLTEEECAEIENTLTDVPAALLDPAKW